MFDATFGRRADEAKRLCVEECPVYARCKAWLHSIDDPALRPPGIIAGEVIRLPRIGRVADPFMREALRELSELARVSHRHRLQAINNKSMRSAGER